jgi:hypothetical protein
MKVSQRRTVETPKPMLQHCGALEREVPVDAKAGRTAGTSFRYRLAVLLGHRPAPEDLQDLAGRYYPEFAKP